MKKKMMLCVLLLAVSFAWMNVTDVAQAEGNGLIDISTCQVEITNMVPSADGGYTTPYTGDLVTPQYQLRSADGTYLQDKDTYLEFHIEATDPGKSLRYGTTSIDDAGHYVMIIEPISIPVFFATNKYTGELRVPLTITPYDMGDTLITVSGIDDEVYDYTGKAFTPDVRVKFGNWILEETEDYTVSYQNNIDAGQAYVLIEGVKDAAGNYSGNFTGVKQVPFHIVKSLKYLEYSKAASEEYKGGSVTPQITVTDVLADGSRKTLAVGTDYTVKYENNSAIGVGRIIITGQGDYKDYHLVKFGLLPKKVTGVKVKSPFAMEATVTWNKVANADGFYVYRKSGSGSFKFIANITDGNYQVFHDKDKSLKAGTKYTYRIVPYVMDENSSEDVDGKKYSAPKKNKITYDGYYSSADYKNGMSYYAKLDTLYYGWYNYSCIKGKCNIAFEGEGTEGSGKVTKSATKKRYIIYTGSADVDYMVYSIDKKLIKNGMSDEKRVRAIFNWMVQHCTFTKDVKDYDKLKNMKRYFNFDKKSTVKKAEAYEKKVMAKIYKGEALCIGMGWHDADRVSTALEYRKGSCSYLTPMFNVLCNGAGVEAYIVDGDYVNADKSKMYHNWSFVQISGKYYWFDVPVACKNKSSKDYWYKKGTSFQKKYHSMTKNATKGFDSKKFAK